MASRRRGDLFELKREFSLQMVCGVKRDQVRLRACFAMYLMLLPSVYASATDLGAPSSFVAHVDAAIDRLDAPKFFEREAATRELLQRGSAIIPQLESALQSAKGETRYRIRMILDQQRASTDSTTRQAAQQALARIAASKDKSSAAWARSLISPPIETPIPTLLESPPGA
jgi:hypothetical protein